MSREEILGDLTVPTSVLRAYWLRASPSVGSRDSPMLSRLTHCFWPHPTGPLVRKRPFALNKPARADG